jgi:hypothetical protein
MDPIFCVSIRESSVRSPKDLGHFYQFIQTVSAVAQSSLLAQLVPDLLRKPAGRPYRKNARRPARKRPTSKARIVIEGSEFEPLLERLHRTLEHLRGYASTCLPRRSFSEVGFLFLVFCHIICRRVFTFSAKRAVSSCLCCHNRLVRHRRRLVHLYHHGRSSALPR